MLISSEIALLNCHLKYRNPRQLKTPSLNSSPFKPRASLNGSSFSSASLERIKSTIFVTNSSEEPDSAPAKATPISLPTSWAAKFFILKTSAGAISK